MEAILAKDDPVVSHDPLALGALQAQIAELGEKLAQLEAARERDGKMIERVAQAERGLCLLAAIVGELHTNAVRSDIAPLIQQLKVIVAPLVKEKLDVAA